MSADTISKMAIVTITWTALGVMSSGHAANDQRNSACNAFTSTKTTIQEVTRNAKKFLGKCISVSGVTHERFVYQNVDGLYMTGTSRMVPTSNGLTLGIRNVSDNTRIEDGFNWATLVGRVGSCDVDQAEARAESTDGIFVIVTGYCHYFGGPYMDVDRVVSKRGPAFTRQVNQSGLRGYGNLKSASLDWPHRERVASAAREFLTALRGRDVNVLATMHFTDNVARRQEEVRQLAEFLLEQTDSPFAELRESTESPQLEILVEHVDYNDSSKEAEEPYVDEDDYSATICFCRSEECSGRWPIATFDADNLPTRPYACTRYGPYGQLHPSWSIYDTPMEKIGLVEPAE